MTRSRSLANFPSTRIHIKEKGAKGDGSDDSGAFQAAIDSLDPVKGGIVDVSGMQVYANVTVLKNNVTIAGDSCWDVSTGTTHIHPFNPALPVITVGNDSASIYSFMLDKVSLYGDPSGTSQYGLLVNGGLQTLFAHELSVRNFGNHGIKLGPGVGREIQWAFFDKLIVRNPSSGTPVGFGCYYGNNPAWNTVLYIDKVKMEGSTYGYLIVNDSCQLAIGGGWLQGTDLHGIKLQKTYSSNPFLIGYGRPVVEATGGSNCGLYTAHTNSTLKNTFLMGDIYFNSGAKVEGQDHTVRTMVSGPAIGSAELYGCTLINANVADSSNPTQSNLHISASGNVLRLVNDTAGSSFELTSGNNANAYSAHLKCQTAGYGLGLKTGSNCRAGSATLVNGTVTVSNTSVPANSAIMITTTALNSSTAIGEITVPSRVANTSFTVTSVVPASGMTQTGDQRSFDYVIIELL